MQWQLWPHINTQGRSSLTLVTLLKSEASLTLIIFSLSLGTLYGRSSLVRPKDHH